MSKIAALVKDAGMRKLIVMFAALLVVLILICGGRFVLPSDLEMARMIVDASLGFLIMAFGIFVGGNVLEHATKMIPMLKSFVAPKADK